MILALDPGRDKVGLALADGEGQQINLKIVVREELAEEVLEILENPEVDTIVLGNGTCSRELVEEIAGLLEKLQEISEEQQGRSDGQPEQTEQKRQSGLKNNLKLKREMKREMKLGLVEESGSTREARELYREDNPGGQLKKLLLQVMDWRPAVPLDHYAALVLARRYLKTGFLEKIC